MYGSIVLINFPARPCRASGSSAGRVEVFVALCCCDESDLCALTPPLTAFSGPNQPPNPEQKSHPFRRKPATVPGQSGHPAFVGLG